jgi:hypothetical protein
LKENKVGENSSFFWSIDDEFCGGMGRDFQDEVVDEGWKSRGDRASIDTRQE